MPASPRLSELAAELQEQPQVASNNVPLIIDALQRSSDKAELGIAVRALMDFFSEAYEQGHLSTKRRKVPGNTAPVTVYREWLCRQHSAYLSALVGLLRRDLGPQVQKDAVAATMHAVRAPTPGEFSSDCFAPLLEALLTSSRAAPRVLAGFLGSYLRYADVRLYCLRTAAKLCAARGERRTAGNGGGGDGGGDGDGSKAHAAGRRGRRPLAVGGAAAAAASMDDSEDEEGVGGSEDGKSAGEDGVAGLSPWQASNNDVVRNVYDLLSRVEPDFEGAAGIDRDGGGGLLQSWTGVAEAGVAAAATAGTGERSKDRRKRRREGGGGEAADVGIVSVRWANPQVQRRAFSKAWLALLGMELPDDVYRKVLLRCHDALIPHLQQPLLLSDFLSWALRKGGLLGMLALNGIFVLVTKHGLEYPRFYERLYGLLTPDAFRAKYRARFFQLADIFLASPAVPAYTAAAFAKRFARMALSAPPAGAMVALAFIHNILRRHPQCAVLVHRPTKQQEPAAAAAASALPAGEAASDDGEEGSLGRGGGSSSSEGEDVEPAAARGGAAAGHVANGHHAPANGHHANGIAGEAAAPTAAAAADSGGGAAADAAVPRWDVYDEAQSDPAYSRAIESSLWEVEALRNHYSPQVCALAGLLDKDFSDRKKTAEADLHPLLQASYSSLVSADLKRRLKPQVATAFYPRPPAKLFDAALCGADFGGWKL